MRQYRIGIFEEGGELISTTYVQLFRNGIIEATEDGLLLPEHNEKILPITTIEGDLIMSISSYLQIQKIIRVEPPILVFLTLAGVKDHYYYDLRRGRRKYTIDRDTLQLPEVLIEDFNVNVGEIMKPCFDAIWNACGISKSPNYNENGVWVPPP